MNKNLLGLLSHFCLFLHTLFNTGILKGVVGVSNFVVCVVVSVSVVLSVLWFCCDVGHFVVGAVVMSGLLVYFLVV